MLINNKNMNQNKNPKDYSQVGTHYVQTYPYGPSLQGTARVTGSVSKSGHVDPPKVEVEKPCISIENVQVSKPFMAELLELTTDQTISLHLEGVTVKPTEDEIFKSVKQEIVENIKSANEIVEDPLDNATPEVADEDFLKTAKELELEQSEIFETKPQTQEAAEEKRKAFDEYIKSWGDMQRAHYEEIMIENKNNI